MAGERGSDGGNSGMHAGRRDDTGGQNVQPRLQLSAHRQRREIRFWLIRRHVSWIALRTDGDFKGLGTAFGDRCLPVPSRDVVNAVDGDPP